MEYHRLRRTLCLCAVLDDLRRIILGREAVGEIVDLEIQVLTNHSLELGHIVGKIAI